MTGEPAVWVHRHSGDPRTARFRLADIAGIRWGRLDVNAYVVQGTVQCDRVLAGELVHQCARRTRPHRVLVCVCKSGNDRAWPAVLALAGPRPKPQPFVARVVLDGEVVWSGPVTSAAQARRRAANALNRKRLRRRRGRIEFAEWANGFQAL